MNMAGENVYHTGEMLDPKFTTDMVDLREATKQHVTAVM